MTRNPETLGRRLFMGGSLAVLATTAYGCSTERTKQPASSKTGAAGGPTNDGIITVNFYGPAEQLYRNWNPFSPAANKASGLGYFYEPLIHFDRYHQYKAEPWLAQRWETNSSYDELTFQLRTDVTWSDGKKLTADDVVYSLSLPQKYANSNLLVTDIGVAKVTKVDEHTVKVKMKQAGLQSLVNVGSQNIYPQHVLSQQKLDKWTNPSPVGTGPWVLSKFSPQQVTLVPNKNYWGGALDQFQECRWAIYGTEDAGRALVTQGKVDMSTSSWPNAQKTFVDKGKDNVYRIYPTGGGAALLYNCGRAPFDNVHIRRAISKAIDFTKVMSLYDVGSGVINVTGLAESVWGDAIAPEFRGKSVAPDTATAKKELAASGYTVKGGKLVKDGTSHSVSLKTIAEYTNWSTWADGIKQQLLENLGLDVVVQKVPNAQLSKQEALGQFDIAMDFGGGGSQLLSQAFSNGAASLKKSDVVPEGKEADANYMRFSNEKVSKLLDQMAQSTDEAAITKMCQEVQRIYVDQQPFIAYAESANYVVLNGTKWTNLPTASAHPGYVPTPYGSPDTTLMYKGLKPSGNS